MDKELREMVEGAEGRAIALPDGQWFAINGRVVCENDNTTYALADICLFNPDPDADDDPDQENVSNFIAHARQDVPALCAAVRRLDAEREKLNQSVCAFLRALDTAEADPLGTGLTKRRAVEARAALETIVGSPYAGCDLEDIP